MTVKYMLPFTPHFTNIQEGPVGLLTGYHDGLNTPQSSPHERLMSISVIRLRVFYFVDFDLNSVSTCSNA